MKCIAREREIGSSELGHIKLYPITVLSCLVIDNILCGVAVKYLQEALCRIALYLSGCKEADSFCTGKVNCLSFKIFTLGRHLCEDYLFECTLNYLDGTNFLRLVAPCECSGAGSGCGSRIESCYSDIVCALGERFIDIYSCSGYAAHSRSQSSFCARCSEAVNLLTETERCSVIFKSQSYFGFRCIVDYNIYGLGNITDLDRESISAGLCCVDSLGIINDTYLGITVSVYNGCVAVLVCHCYFKIVISIGSQSFSESSGRLILVARDEELGRRGLCIVCLFGRSLHNNTRVSFFCRSLCDSKVCYISCGTLNSQIGYLYGVGQYICGLIRNGSFFFIVYAEIISSCCKSLEVFIFRFCYVRNYRGGSCAVCIDTYIVSVLLKSIGNGKIRYLSLSGIVKCHIDSYLAQIDIGICKALGKNLYVSSLRARRKSDLGCILNYVIVDRDSALECTVLDSSVLTGACCGCREALNLEVLKDIGLCKIKCRFSTALPCYYSCHLLVCCDSGHEREVIAYIEQELISCGNSSVAL